MTGTDARPKEQSSLRRLLVAALLGALFLVVAVYGAAAADLRAWSPALNISSSPGRSSAVHMAQDPISGTIHAVWVDEGPGNEEILTRRWNPSDQEWTPVENLSNYAWLDGGANLLFDSEGRGHLLWTRRYAPAFGAPEQGTDLLYRQWHDGAWQPEVVLDHNPAFLAGAYGLVLAEKSDRVVLFLVWSGGYSSAEFHNGAWSSLTAWDYSLGVNFGRIIVDDQDHLHAAALGPNSSWTGYDPYFFDAYYLYNNGFAWSTPLNLSGVRGVASDLDLAFDTAGRLHFVWSDPDSPYSSESLKSAIWERVLDGGAWTQNTEITLDNPNQAILDVDLMADLSGTLHLAWSEGLMVSGAATGVDVHHQTGDGTTWADEQKVFGSAQMSRNLALLVSEGQAHLAWEEGETSSSLEIFFTHQAPPAAICCRTYLPTMIKDHP